MFPSLSYRHTQCGSYSEQFFSFHWRSGSPISHVELCLQRPSRCALPAPLPTRHPLRGPSSSMPRLFCSCECADKNHGQAVADCFKIASWLRRRAHLAQLFALRSINLRRLGFCSVSDTFETCLLHL